MGFLKQQFEYVIVETKEGGGWVGEGRFPNAVGAQSNALVTKVCGTVMVAISMIVLYICTRALLYSHFISSTPITSDFFISLLPLLLPCIKC